MIRASKRLQHQDKTLLRQIIDAAPPNAINLGLGQPITPPSPLLLQAASNALSGCACYSPNAGLPELRNAIAQRHHTHPSQVIVTIGAEEALFLAIAGVVDPGDEVLVPDPGFPVYASIARWAGATALTYPLKASNGFALDPDDLINRLTPRTRLVIFNTPANPTGACHSQEALTTILNILQDRQILYLSDEVYASLSFDNNGDLKTPPLPSKISPLGLVADSFSKRHALMGWRLGWLIAPEPLSKPLIALHQLIATCAAVPIQLAGIAALTDDGLLAERSLAHHLAERRQLALQTLQTSSPQLPPPKSTGALYLFLNTSAYLNGDDVALAYELLNDGVITIPGQAFGPGGRSFIRLSFGVEPHIFNEGVARIQKGLQRLELIG